MLTLTRFYFAAQQAPQGSGGEGWGVPIYVGIALGSLLAISLVGYLIYYCNNRPRTDVERGH